MAKKLWSLSKVIFLDFKTVFCHTFLSSELQLIIFALWQSQKSGIRDPQGKDWLITSLLRWGDLQQHTKQNAISSPTDSNQRYIAISFLQISEDTFNKKKWSYFKGFPKSSCCLSELCLRCVEYVIKCRLSTGTETWQCEVLKPTPTHQQNWIISW